MVIFYSLCILRTIRVHFEYMQCLLKELTEPRIKSSYNKVFQYRKMTACHILTVLSGSASIEGQATKAWRSQVLKTKTSPKEKVGNALIYAIPHSHMMSWIAPPQVSHQASISSLSTLYHRCACLNLKINILSGNGQLDWWSQQGEQLCQRRCVHQLQWPPLQSPLVYK